MSQPRLKAVPFQSLNIRTVQGCCTSFSLGDPPKRSPQPKVIVMALKYWGITIILAKVSIGVLGFQQQRYLSHRPHEFPLPRSRSPAVSSSSASRCLQSSCLYVKTFQSSSTDDRKGDSSRDERIGNKTFQKRNRSWIVLVDDEEDYVASCAGP